MAAAGEYFSKGAIVECSTCFDQVVEGEVIAFDQPSKMLVLKNSPSKTTKTNDVYILNLSLCTDIQVKKEGNPNVDVPQMLNITKLNTRVRNTIDQKKRWLSAISANVSPEGRKLYMVISKTINHIAWKDQSIVVFDDVIIKAPYRKEDVNGRPNSRQLLFVKKIVEKFIIDQNA